MEYLIMATIILLNVMWGITNWRRLRIYKIERDKLMDWLDEVPEHWGVPEDLWKIQMGRLTRFMKLSG